MSNPAPQLPDDGFVRLPDIIGARGLTGTKRERIAPPALIPVSRATWWRGVRDGRYPQPVRLGPNSVAWRARDIRALLEKLAEAA